MSRGVIGQVVVIAVAVGVLATACAGTGSTASGTGNGTAGGATGAGGAAGAGGAGGGPAAPGMDVGTQLSGPIPAKILNLPLVDSTGKRTSLAAFHGKTLVISDTMTLCQETCPLDTANIVSTARAVQSAGLGDKVEFLSISFDPQRDTVPQIAAYRALYSPPPADWSVLTGDPVSLAALWKYLGVYYERVAEGTPPAKNWRTGQTLTYDLDHADEVFFVDGSGNERFLLDGAAYVKPGTTVPKPLLQFLSADGHKNLTNPDQGSWTVPQALGVVSWLSGTEISGATS